MPKQPMHIFQNGHTSVEMVSMAVSGIFEVVLISCILLILKVACRITRAGNAGVPAGKAGTGNALKKNSTDRN